MEKHPKSPYRLGLLEEDRRNLGWTFTKIAAETGLAISTVARFFKGSFSSPGTAKRIALAMGHPVSRYVIQREPEQRAS